MNDQSHVEGMTKRDFEALTDDELVAIADACFLQLDREEEDSAKQIESER